MLFEELLGDVWLFYGLCVRLCSGLFVVVCIESLGVLVFLIIMVFVLSKFCIMGEFLGVMIFLNVFMLLVFGVFLILILILMVMGMLCKGFIVVLLVKVEFVLVVEVRVFFL